MHCAGEYRRSSFVERQNWTVRTTMRRCTRPSNGFSRKIENHMAAVAINDFAYNFIKIHGFHQVDLYVLVVVDSRESNCGAFSYDDGMSPGTERPDPSADIATPARGGSRPHAPGVCSAHGLHPTGRRLLRAAISSSPPNRECSHSALPVGLNAHWKRALPSQPLPATSGG